MANSVYESGVINSVWLQLVVMVIIRDSIFVRFILQNEKERSEGKRRFMSTNKIN